MDTLEFQNYTQGWGDADIWKLLHSESNIEESWAKTTEAMVVPTGVVLKTTVKQGETISQALQFLPGLVIVENISGNQISSRTLELNEESKFVRGRLLEDMKNNR